MNSINKRLPSMEAFLLCLDSRLDYLFNYGYKIGTFKMSLLVTI
ncbi:hypothetical protein J2S10_004388 [Neobacillus ginsengisoli]|uniref:Uncharacterized protein n=1 Tax=Neobacillus ginsengisoli TaxID=904295 RepID=A0ABT9Y025_9BACI|nr:hypothetical protein [Neobacillus ginsengisoli]